MQAATAPSDNASATAAVARCHKALDLPMVLQAEMHEGRMRMVWRGDGRHGGSGDVQLL